MSLCEYKTLNRKLEYSPFSRLEADISLLGPGSTSLVYLGEGERSLDIDTTRENVVLCRLLVFRFVERH